MINRAVELYNKKAEMKVAPYDSTSKAVTEDFFDLLMAVNPFTKRQRILDAYARAKAIHQTKCGQGSEWRESVTTMYELVCELGVVTEAPDGTLKMTENN